MMIYRVPGSARSLARHRLNSQRRQKERCEAAGCRKLDSSRGGVVCVLGRSRRRMLVAVDSTLMRGQQVAEAKGERSDVFD